MKSPALRMIEEGLPLLSNNERLWLIEQFAKDLRKQPPPPNFDADLTAMANDPEIQREIRAINAEFRCTDADGLDAL